ncbi:unnamed protein product, partial [Prorocentrum cordatum]
MAAGRWRTVPQDPLQDPLQAADPWDSAAAAGGRSENSAVSHMTGPERNPALLQMAIPGDLTQPEPKSTNFGLPLALPPWKSHRCSWRWSTVLLAETQDTEAEVAPFGAIDQDSMLAVWRRLTAAAVTKAAPTVMLGAGGSFAELFGAYLDVSIAVLVVAPYLLTARGAVRLEHFLREEPWHVDIDRGLDLHSGWPAAQPTEIAPAKRAKIDARRLDISWEGISQTAPLAATGGHDVDPHAPAALPLPRLRRKLRRCSALQEQRDAGEPLDPRQCRALRQLPALRAAARVRAPGPLAQVQDMDTLACSMDVPRCRKKLDRDAMPSWAAAREMWWLADRGRNVSFSMNDPPLVQQLMPKYKAAREAKDAAALQALELVCPELAKVAEPMPAPAILLEQEQIVANSKTGKELLRRLNENSKACNAAQDEDLQLLTPEQQQYCKDAAAAAQQSQAALQSATDAGKQAREAAATLRNLREQVATTKRRKADTACGVAPGGGGAAAADASAPPPVDAGGQDFSNPEVVEAYIKTTASRRTAVAGAAASKAPTAPPVAPATAAAPAAATGAAIPGKGDGKDGKGGKEYRSASARTPFGKRDFASIFFGSATSYSPKVKRFIETPDHDMIGLAEHHLCKGKCDQEEKRLRSFGWRSEGTCTPASPSTRSDSGTHGGACWLRRATYATSVHLQGANHQSVFQDALQDVSVVLWRFQGATFAFIVCYLDCSIGLAGTNARNMTAIARIVKCLGIPWCLVGDFNATPEELARSGWPLTLKARILTPEGVNITCTSGKVRMLDYVVVPDSFRPFLKRVMPVQKLPWGPRIGLDILVTARPAAVMSRAPVLPVPLDVPAGGVHVPKGIKRRQRDRQRHAELQQAKEDCDQMQEGDLLNDDEGHLLEDTYTQWRPQQCNDHVGAPWAEYATEAQERAGTRIPAGEEVQASVAYQMDPYMAQAMAVQRGYWAEAAEAQLAELCGTEPRDRARRGQPVKHQWRKAQEQTADSQFGHACAQDIGGKWVSLNARVQEQLIALGRHRHTEYQRKVQATKGKWRMYLDDYRVLGHGERICYSRISPEWQAFALRVQARAARHACLVWQQTRSEVQAWAKASTLGSMRGGHRYLKKDEVQALDKTCVDPDTGEVCDSEQASTEARARRWRDRWTSKPDREPALREALSELRTLAREALPERRYHSRDDMVNAIRTFPRATGKGADQWTPGHLLAVSDQGQEAFVTLLNMVEQALAWPHQLLHNWYALLPKGAEQVVGNERDVGLLPLPVRIWGRMTKAAMAQWCDKRAGHWGAAVRGSSALQAALLTVVLDEARARAGVAEQSNVLMDVEKFYDYIDLALMIHKGISLEVPPVELYLCCLTCLAPRVVKSHGAFSSTITPNGSILPGCGKAKHWARAFLYHLLEAARARPPAARVRQYVDDVHSRIEGAAEEVLDHAKDVAVTLVQGCLDLGLRVSPKSILMMTRPRDEKAALTYVYPETGIRAQRASTAKDLGIDCAMGSRRSNKTARARMAAARAADLTGHTVGGRCTSTTLLLRYRDDEPKMAALAQQVKEWFHFWARHSELRDRVRLGWRAVLKRLLYLRPRARWKCATGPAGAIILALRDIGWIPRAPDVWIDDEGSEWRHLGNDGGSAQDLVKAIKSTVTRQLWRQAGDHPLGAGLGDGGDLHMLRINLMRMCRQERHKEAGALEAGALAGIRTGARAQAAGYQCSGDCEHCGEGKDTIEHRLYFCSATCEMGGGPWVERTEGLRQHAMQDLLENRHVAYWTRGKVPLEWVAVPPPPAWNSGEGLGVRAVGTFPPILDSSSSDALPSSSPALTNAVSFNVGAGEYPIRARLAFLGGSATSSDARVCRVGWGVYFVGEWAELEADDGEFSGFFGAVDGDQTVPVAELAALWRALQLSTGPLDIFTDCQLFFKGWVQGNAPYPRGCHAKWWARIRSALEQRGGQNVRLHKIFSHLDTDSHVRSGQDPRCSRGNELADALAQRGAESAANPIRTHVKALQVADARATLVHQRIGAVLAPIYAEVERGARSNRFGGADDSVGSASGLGRIGELEEAVRGWLRAVAALSARGARLCAWLAAGLVAWAASAALRRRALARPGQPPARAEEEEVVGREQQHAAACGTGVPSRAQRREGARRQVPRVQQHLLAGRAAHAPVPGGGRPEVCQGRPVPGLQQHLPQRPEAHAALLPREAAALRRPAGHGQPAQSPEPRRLAGLGGGGRGGAKVLRAAGRPDAETRGTKTGI